MSEEQRRKNKSYNDKLIIGVIIGAVLGFLIYWSLDVVTIHSETIFIILVVVAILLALILFLLTWFRNRLIKRFFGRHIAFGTILNDTQETLQIVSENLTKNIPAELDKKEKIKLFLPKLINYILWSNFRNWGLRIFTSFVLGLGGIVTTILILNQNKLFENQNKRIEQQTHLIEADRRSAQVFIMGEVLSDINKELEDELNERRTLSNSLLGRIVSLSRAMKPYRYLENDTLIEVPLSPERGQLLISLSESKIDSSCLVENILLSSDFRSSELINSRLPKSILVSVNLMNADLNNATFYNSNFTSSNLINANLYNVNFRGATFTKANLSNSNLEGAMLQRATFKFARLEKANLSFVEMNRKTDFTDASLDSVIVHRKDWITFLRDSIKVKGGQQIFNKYKVEKLNSTTDDKYVLIRKPSIFNF